MILFDEQEKDQNSTTRIKVVGVGGAGGNTVNFMIKSGLKGVEFYVANTDVQALENSLAKVKIQLGPKSTKGLGAGANPEVGKRAAEEDIDKIIDSFADADIVFVTGGLGKGTASGAIPVIVRTLKEKGILTIVIVTKPFAHEGKRRAAIADQALDTIKGLADTLIVIPNQKLLEVTDNSTSMMDGFGMIYQILNQSVKSISDIITGAGYINVDFADVSGIMKDKGLAVMGTGRASGPGRAKKAALEAISSPLLENMSIQGARAVLLNITGGLNLGLHEMSEAASVIYELADQDANIIVGSVIDPLLEDEVSVTVIATELSGVQLERKALEKESVFYTPVRLHQQKQPVSVVEKNVERVEVVRQELQAPVAAVVVVEAKQEVPVVQQAASHAPVMPVQELKPFQEESVVIEQKLQVASPEVIVLPVAKKELAIGNDRIDGACCQTEKIVSVEQSCAIKPLTEEEEFELLLKEEEALRLEESLRLVPKANEQNEQLASAATSEAVKTQKDSFSTGTVGMIDINDLDVPAFMRREAKEKQNRE